MWDHHTRKKCVMELNRAADSLRTKSEIVNSLCCYVPGTVLILLGRLLNHMTFITKVGVSYIDYMNDDTLEVDSFSHESLSSPRF